MSDFPNVLGAFSDLNKTVINWEGENFYRACGAHVVEHSDGTLTSCVKRIGHHTDIHEDYDGVIRREHEFMFDSLGDDDEDEDEDGGIKVNVGSTSGDSSIQPIREGESRDFIHRHLAWERARDLIDLVVDKFGLKEHLTKPSGLTLGYSTTNTEVDQYLAHVKHLANWLLGEED